MIPRAKFHLKLAIAHPRFEEIERVIPRMNRTGREGAYPEVALVILPGYPVGLVYGSSASHAQWEAYSVGNQNIRIRSKHPVNKIGGHFVLCLVVNMKDAYFTIQSMLANIIHAKIQQHAAILPTGKRDEDVVKFLENKG
jgi:hypothetical protein